MEQYAVCFALVCAVAAIVYGLVSARWILGLPQGNERMQQIAAAIQEGAGAYMKRQYTIIAVVGVVIFLILAMLPSPLGLKTAIGFAIGAVFPVLPVLSACLYRSGPTSAPLRQPGPVFRRL